MSATATPVMPGQSDPFAALGGVYETPAPTAAPAPPPAAKPAADPFAGLGAQYEAPATPAPAPLRPPQAPFAPLPTQRIDMASLPAAPGPAPLPTQRIDMAATALNRSKNPEDQAPEVSYGFNRPWAKAGPYTTKLAPADEAKFQQWVKQNKVPWQDTPTSDYDMRGYWQAMQQGNATQQHSNFDGTMHYPDTWKTPYSGVFSRESMYATPEAPRWVGDRLVTRHGQIVTDETPRPQPIPAPAAPPKQPQTTQLPRPAGSPYWQGQVAEQGALLQYVPAPIKNFFTWANEKPLVDYAPDDSGQLTGPAQHAKQIWDGFQKDHPQIAAILDPVGAGEKYLARHPALAAAHDRLQQDLNAMTTPANVGMVAGGFFSKLGTISDVLAAVFTQQAVKGVYSSAKQAAQAYKEGNNPAAAALATDALFNATVAGLALHHGLNANAASEPEIAPGRVAQYRAQQAATRLVDEARPGGGPQEVVPDTDEQLRERAKSRIRAIADSGREQQVRVPGPDGQPKDVTIPARLLSRDELTEMRNLRQMLDDPASLRGYFWDLDHPKESSTAKAFDGLGAVYEPEASPTENVAQVSRGTSGEPGQRSVADVFGVPTPEENAAEDRRVRRQNEVRRIAAGAPPIGTEEPETGRTVMQQSPRPEVNQAAATAEHPAVKQTISDALEPIEGARLAGARDEKSPERVEEKIESEDQSPRTLRDYSGFRIAVDTPEARDQAAAALRQRFEVPDEQDEFDKGNEETGFHGMTLQVREPGSPVSHEVQILPREVAENADARHGLYEKAREGDKAAMARLKAQNEADYQRFRERNKILPAMAGEGGRGATPEPPAEGAAPVFKHGSTQANIPDESEAGKALAGLRSKIAPQDLAGDVNGTEGGLETHPHVTVRYGVKGDDTAGIERFIESQKPFEATLGATHSFPASEHSDGAVPIVAPVESPELHRINAEIEKHGAFAASSFPDYKPHATVAYVKPGTEGKYVNLSDAQGQRFPIDHISITDRNGNEKQVPLRGRGEEKGKQPEIISPDAERQATKALEDFDRRMLEKYGEDYHAPRDESPLTPEELREGDRLAVAEREARLRQGNYARPVAPETANAHITEGGISANAENKAAPGHLPTAAEGPFTEGSRVLRYDFNPDEAWVGFDLDKTLAHDEGFKGPEHIGEPIPEGVDRLKQLLDQGVKARILTARVAHDPDGMARATIEKWVKQHVGQELPITAVKDPNMIRLYDDRAATVEPNTGRLLAEPQEKIHALQERGPGGVLQRQPEEAGGAGGGRGRVEQGERGAEAAGAQPQLEGLGIPGGARPAETEVTPAADLRPNQVARVPVAELHADPKRFQYKMSATSAAGTSDLLHGRKWNDALAGVISVWRDPADGKVYVVNGHHRFELASGSGVPAMNVLMLEAPTAEAARSIGAMQNIAEGRGTPMDAAKFFRDSGFTPADLDRIGISMGEATAANGIALSRLADPIFDDVVTGKLRLNRAIAIGKATDVPEEQEAILKLVERAEARGRKVSDDTVDELARMAKGAGSHTDFQQTLFGTQAETRNLALEKAEVSSYIREQIGKEKRIFGSVADEKKAAQLGSAGNRINAAKNREIATNAAQAQELYDRLSTRAGDVDTILNRAAQQLAEGKETPAAIKQRAYDDVRKALSETLTGRPQGGDRGIRTGTEAAPAVAAQRVERTTQRAEWSKGDRFTVRNPATGEIVQGEVTFYNGAPNGGKPGGRAVLSDGTKLNEIPRDAVRVEGGAKSARNQGAPADEYARGIDEARKRSVRENAAHQKATVTETGVGNAVVLDPDGYALWHRAGMGEKTAWKGVSLSREAANKLELMLRSMAGSARKEVGGADTAAGYDRMATALREARQPDGSVMLLRGDYTPDTVLEEGWHQWQRRNKMAQSEAMHAVADRPEFREIADQLRAMGYGKGGREGRTEVALELMAKAMAGDPALKLTPDQRFDLVHAFARAAAEEHGSTIFKDMPPVTPEAEAALREARHGYEAESDEAGRGGAARGAAAGRNEGVQPLAGSEGRAGDTRGSEPAGGRGQQGLPEGGAAEGELAYQRARGGLLPEDSLGLPGMEDADREREAAKGEAQAQLLSDEMRRPKGDISDAAGRMERESPLFYGKGENPSLFGEPETPAEGEQMALFQKDDKENPVAKSIQSLIDDLDKMRPEDRRSAVERFSDWAGETFDDAAGRAGAFWRRVPGLEKGLAHANAFAAALAHDFQFSGEPSRLADKARTAVSTAWSKARSVDVPHPTDWKGLLGDANVSRTEAALALRALKKSVREAVPDKTTRAAIKYWIEANGDPRKLNEWAQKAEQRWQWASGRKMDARLKDHYRDSVAHYKAAAALDPQQREAAQRVKQHFDDLLKVWQDNGLLYHAARNYVNHLYVRTGEAENLAHLIDLSELNPNPGFIKDRVFNTYFEAENHGLIPKSPDILDLMSAYDAAGNEALTTRTLLRNMLTAKNEAGKPLAVLNTSGRWIVAREDEAPQVMKRQEVPEDIDLRDYREFPELPQTRGFLFEPTAEDLKGFEQDPKLWEEDPSRIAFKGSLYFLRSEKGGVANQVEDMMTPGWFDRNQTLMQKIGHGALQLNALTKEVMTSLIPAPFHLFNVSQRVIEHWANPFRLPEIDMKDEVTRGLVANGLNPLDAEAEGLMSARMLKGIFEGVPGMNVAMDRVHGFSQWLFRDWIPRAAVDLGKKAFEANTRIYGKEFEERALRELGPTMRNATEAQRKAAAKDLAERMLYELSAKQANHAVGMMNTAFDAMPRSKSTKQLTRLIFFAPEFLESTGRYVGQAALPHGRVQAVSLMRGAAMIYLAARGLNAAFNKGDAKWDKRHAFNVQIGDKDYGVRWALGDMVHMVRDPRNFAMNRLSSPFSAAFEFATGRNKYGQQRNFPDEVRDAVTRALPFQVQKVFTTPDVSLLETMLGASGIYPAQDRTPAEEMVHKVYVANIPDMPDDPDRQARSRKNYQLEDQLREGKIKARDVLAKAEDHEISTTEAWRIVDRAQQPRLVNEFMSAGLRFLPLRKGDPSILDVWKAASPQEKLELRPYLARKGESQLPEIDDPQVRAALVQKWRDALAEVPAEEEPPTVEPGQKVLASK